MGNLVTQNQTRLTTIVSVDPIYVHFEMDEPTLLRHRRALNEGKLAVAQGPYQDPGAHGAARRGGLPAPGDHQLRRQPGQSDDGQHPGARRLCQPRCSRAATGSVARQVRENPAADRGTPPGPAGHRPGHRVGSEGQKYVYVLDADRQGPSRAGSRRARLQADGLRAIEEGLKPDDWVLSGGILQTRQGGKIKPDRVPMPTLGQPAAGCFTVGRSRLVGVAWIRIKPSDRKGRRHALQLLHRSTDLRDGTLRRHHVDRRDLAGLAADGAVSADHAARVSVTINYPGASAPVVADTVAAVIEQQVNGVEGMLYMSSQMGNDGSYTLTVTFDIGTDVNSALVMVQNRVALAMPQLPPRSPEPGDHDPQEERPTS